MKLVKWVKLVSVVHFFDIWTSKKGQNLQFFDTFDVETCFKPQPRALFRHLNVQKWSDVGVLCAFWLGNVLRTTTAFAFSTSELPKVVRHWCALYILTWKWASRHNDVQFLIYHLASWLRTRRFSKPTFRPFRGTNHWKKNSESRLSYLFVHLHLLSSLSFSSLIFSLLVFSSWTLHTFAFPSFLIVGSLTSKLPSMKIIYMISDASIWFCWLVQFVCVCVSVCNCLRTQT